MLYSAGVDTIEKPEIYETYIDLDRISHKARYIPNLKPLKSSGYIYISVVLGFYI
jgi:hypothetical protein